MTGGRALVALALTVTTAEALARPDAIRPDLATAPPGATACSGCHGAAGVAGSTLPPIYGRPAAEIVAALAAFRSGERPATVMNRLAPGFSEAESRAIADWLSEQRP